MHRHRVKHSHDRAFAGSIRDHRTGRENPRAHGNITREEECACGATRLSNLNAGATESTGWIDREEYEARA